MDAASFFDEVIITACPVQGVVTKVGVIADYQPAEPETNTPECVEVGDVLSMMGISILATMSRAEIKALAESLLIDYRESLSDYQEVVAEVAA